MIALEAKEKKYDIAEHEKRLEVVIEKWDTVCRIIREEIPAVETLEAFLNLTGIPKTVEEIGIECDIPTAFKATKDMRKKYMLSMLLWDLGELENIRI